LRKIPSGENHQNVKSKDYKRKEKYLESGPVLVFVSINIWRSFIGCQIVDVKHHLFSEQAVVSIISFAKNSSLN
jgi:hypothetical protein